jgi:succinate dehydrogenase/fumarate reductase flavoprotein subunit
MGKRGSRLLLNEKLLAQKGVSLKDQAGENIIKKHGFDDFLTVTRDLLAQIMMKETLKGTVVLDLTDMPSGVDKQLSHLLPASYWKGEKRFKVVPTAHFCMGGVITDKYGQTPMAGLFAAGEIAAGTHGANRLGGNSLSEIFSMGSISGNYAAMQAKTPQESSVIKSLADNEKYRIEQHFSPQGITPDEMRTNLKKLMWHKAGILRHRTNLEQALEMLEGSWPDICVKTPAELIKSLELCNMRLMATAVCKAALMRTESRGSHFRTDFPAEDNDNWLVNIIVSKTESAMTCKTEPVTTVPLG